MKLLRNREIRNEFILDILMSIALSAVPVFLCRSYSHALTRKLVIIIFSAGIVKAFVHLRYASKRVGIISEMSRSIDRILHGEHVLLSDENSEGELAILGSEIRKMTVRLRAQADQLQDDKIRLTDAIADIFHQMRTPLTSMNLSVTLLSEEDLDYAGRIHLTRELKKQLERMSWLTEALLKMSKIDAGTAIFEKKSVLVSDLISKASQPLLIPMELRGLKLEILCAKESFIGDISWTSEALGNLLKNAMEHTPEGGTIKVSAQETSLYTRITVEDDGEGFDPADIPNLFQRFYKGSNATPESIGIGLALSRAIISSQNGTIKAENRDGGGARFDIKFYKNVI